MPGSWIQHEWDVRQGLWWFDVRRTVRVLLLKLWSVRRLHLPSDPPGFSTSADLKLTACEKQLRKHGKRVRGWELSIWSLRWQHIYLQNRTPSSCVSG